MEKRQQSNFHYLRLITHRFNIVLHSKNFVNIFVLRSNLHLPEIWEADTQNRNIETRYLQSTFLIHIRHNAYLNPLTQALSLRCCFIFSFHNHSMRYAGGTKSARDVRTAPSRDHYWLPAAAQASAARVKEYFDRSDW